MTVTVNPKHSLNLFKLTKRNKIIRNAINNKLFCPNNLIMISDNDASNKYKKNMSAALFFPPSSMYF